MKEQLEHRALLDRFVCLALGRVHTGCMAQRPREAWSLHRQAPTGQSRQCICEHCVASTGTSLILVP